MRIPERLVSLADQGIIDEVVRPLMSGKEAEVFLIRSGGELRVAKVYKDAQNRTFKNRAEYTEGRKVRNSRDQRAIDKRSRHGRAQDEAAWRSTEVDMIYRLRDAGVRVPTPHHFIDGVLIMEMVADGDGNPAPRLGELRFSPVEAMQIFDRLLGEVVRMLCAGVVHGDLSDFNVLMSADGPVVIDFPQAVDASSNQNARKLLLRDVANLHRFLSKFAPNQPPRPHAQEMWELFARSQLTPETRLRGQYRAADQRVDTAALLELIGDASHDERRRREANGLSMRGVSAPPRPENPRHQGQQGPRPQPTGDRAQPYQGRPQPTGDRAQPYQGRQQPAGDRSQPYQGRQQPIGDRSQPYQGGQQPAGDRSQPYQGRQQPAGDRSQPYQGRQQPMGDRSQPQQPRQQPMGDRSQPQQARQQPMGEHSSHHQGRQHPPAHPAHPAPMGGPPRPPAPSAPAEPMDEAPRRRRVEVVVVPSGPRGRPRPQQDPPAAGPDATHRRRAAR